MANKNWASALGGALVGGVMNNFAPTRNYSALGSAATGALINKKNPIQGALAGGVGGAVGAGVGSGMTGTGGFGNGFMTGLKQYGGSIPGFGGVGTANPTGVMAKWLTPQSMQGQNNILQQGTAGYSPLKSANGSIVGYNPTGVKMPTINTAAATGGPTGTLPSSGGIPTQSVAKKGIFDNFNMPQFATGAGVSALGGFLTPKVPAPDFSSVTNPLRERISNPSPIAAQSQAFLQNTMNQPMGGSAESGIANARLIADRQRADNARAITQQFAAAQPGADYTNSSEYRNAMAKMNAEADQNYAAQAAQTQFQYDTQQKQNQMAAAQVLQQMDQAQIQSLADLAQYDIQTIMTKTGMDYASAQQVQQLGATAGQFIMQNAAGLNQVQKAAA